MSRRLQRRDLRHASGARMRRLPGRSLDRGAGLVRQAAAGLVGSIVCAVALSLEISISQVAARWSDAAGRTLIVVPDQAAPSAIGGQSRLAAVLSAAGTDAHRVGPEALASLLGAAAADAPALVQTGAIDPGLASQIAAVAPGSIVKADGGQPAARLAAFGARLMLACQAALAVLAAAALAVVVAGARAAISASADTAGLLHQLGMTEGALGRRLAAPLTCAVFLGGATGVAASALVLSPGLSGPDLALLYAIPAIMALATLFAAWQALHRRLQDQ